LLQLLLHLPGVTPVLLLLLLVMVVALLQLPGDLHHHCLLLLLHFPGLPLTLLAAPAVHLLLPQLLMVPLPGVIHLLLLVQLLRAAAPAVQLLLQGQQRCCII
jgi:hypothetical protein